VKDTNDKVFEDRLNALQSSKIFLQEKLDATQRRLEALENQLKQLKLSSSSNSATTTKSNTKSDTNTKNDEPEKKEGKITGGGGGLFGPGKAAVIIFTYKRANAIQRSLTQVLECLSILNYV
jgi:hypothetical protein